MGYKMALDLPNVGEDVEVYLPGLGIYKNGNDYEITDEQAEQFRHAHQVVTYHQDPVNNQVTHTTEELGPTVAEYFKDREGLVLTETKEKAAPKTSAPVEGASNKDAAAGKGGDGE